MTWNWQQADWPNFRYDSAALKGLEEQFLHRSGLLFGAYKHITDEEKDLLKVELISTEALKTSEIEGEILNRYSIQSSIRHNFGLETDNRKIPPAERGIAEMMVDLYRNYAKPLSHQTLFNWHKQLTSGRRDLHDIGRYRTHDDAMQIVSGPLQRPKVHYEAPPSASMKAEMKAFIDGFKKTGPKGKQPLSALTRSGIAHFWFVSIHPFEDGNGRIGRALAKKALSEYLGHPVLIALSQTIQNNKKTYYSMLEQSNKSNEITEWLQYFAQTILDAQDETQVLIDFLIEKARFFDKFRGQINERQEKATLRMFKEGPKGFKGGLSAENYITITETSRATATRDLQSLVQKGALTKTGELKSTRYYLKIKK
ncbi:MAG: Fic family protein [Nitrospinae bacterium]|nr:Fic family protein [Nitrospinota bacterium]MBL7020552.1 Fic family protein [Nitrospinaceae bacterium]